MLFNQSIFYPHRVEKHFINFSEALNIDCFSIVKSDTDLRALSHPKFRNWLQFRKFIVIGTGGSRLGGETICALSPKTNIKFISNVDSDSLEEILSADDDTAFLCISKSGETLETMYILSLLLEKLKLKDRVVVVTEDKESALKSIAMKNDFLCFDHPKTIGGRFSVFSLVGMIPAMICGISPKQIRSGACRVLEDFANSIYKVQESVNFVMNGLCENLTQHVSFIYSDKLSCFGKWLAQLYAESSGKDGRGVTPITAEGSADQHSQLQLYLDGPQDKSFTFFFENNDSKLVLSENAPANFSYLKGISANDVFKAQYNATVNVLKEKSHFVRTIEIEKLSPESLGALFMHFMLEVFGVCRELRVDPFNQPAVERGKVMTKELLGGIAHEV